MVVLLILSLVLSLYAVYKSVENASYKTNEVVKDALKEDERFTKKI